MLQEGNEKNVENEVICPPPGSVKPPGEPAPPSVEPPRLVQNEVIPPPSGGVKPPGEPVPPSAQPPPLVLRDVPCLPPGSLPACETSFEPAPPAIEPPKLNCSAGSKEEINGASAAAIRWPEIPKVDLEKLPGRSSDAVKDSTPRRQSPPPPQTMKGPPVERKGSIGSDPVERRNSTGSDPEPRPRKSQSFNSRAEASRHSVPVEAMPSDVARTDFAGNKKRMMSMVDLNDVPKDKNENGDSRDANELDVLHAREVTTKGLRQAAVMAWLQDVNKEQSSNQDENVSLVREKVRDLVSSGVFTGICLAFIISNVCYVGIETDHNDGTVAWASVELAFSGWFCLELLLRIYAGGVLFFKDRFNQLDVALVAIGCLDASFLVMDMVSPDKSSSSSGSFSFLLVVRIFRLIRVIRVLRLLRFFKELWLIVTGVFQSARTVAWAWALIILILYLFGIFITRTVGSVYGDQDPYLDAKFGTVSRSMFSMFVVVTAEEWPTYCRHAMKFEPYIWLFFVVFISLTTFGVLNVVTAVIVESTLDQAMRNQADIQKMYDKDKQLALENIHRVFSVADKDGNGNLTREEFLEALQDPSVMKNLHDVDIDMGGAESIFDILDYDGSGNLDVTEFMQGCMRARGPAKAKDVLAAQCDLWRAQSQMAEVLRKSMNKWNDRFDRLERELSEVRKLSALLQAAQGKKLGFMKATPRTDSSNNEPPGSSHSDQKGDGTHAKMFDRPAGRSDTVQPRGRSKENGSASNKLRKVTRRAMFLPAGFGKKKPVTGKSGASSAPLSSWASAGKRSTKSLDRQKSKSDNKVHDSTRAQSSPAVKNASSFTDKLKKTLSAANLIASIHSGGKNE